jgi:hypothetical protein
MMYWILDFIPAVAAFVVPVILYLLLKALIDISYTLESIQKGLYHRDIPTPKTQLFARPPIPKVSKTPKDPVETRIKQSKARAEYWAKKKGTFQPPKV